MLLRLRRRITCSTLSLVLMATGAATVLPLPAATASTGGIASLRVMTWNVRQLDNGKHKSRAPEIADKIRAAGVDVAGLQEVGPKLFDKIHKALEERTRVKWYAKRDRDYDKTGGIAILTRIPVTPDDFYAWKLDDDGPKDAQERRLQRVVLRVGGQRVFFYNTHLTHTRTQQDKVKQAANESRARQVKQIQGLVELDHQLNGGLIGNEPQRVVLVGDFNARPWSCPMRALRAAGYADAWAAVEPVSIAFPNPRCEPKDTEWDKDRPGDPCGYRGDGKYRDDRDWEKPCGFTYFTGVRLDYVYTLGVATTQVTVPPSNGERLGDRASFDYISDHYPVLATISVPNVAGGYAAAVRLDEPVSWWPLDDTTPATARDEMGRNDGIVQGGVVPGVPGPFGVGSTAFRFDGGACSGIDVGRNPQSLASSRITVEAWARAATSATGIIFRWRHHGYGFFSLGDGVHFNGYPGGIGSSVQGGSGVADGRWHHLVGSWNGSAWRVYLDGMLVGEEPASGDLYYNGSHAVAIGRDADACDGWVPSFEGDLAHVAVYGSALAPARVRAHFCAARPDAWNCAGA